MKVLFCFADGLSQELNTSYHRAFWPAKMLQEAGHECYLTHVSSLFGSMAEEDVYNTRPFADDISKQIGVPILYGKKAYAAMQQVDAVIIERLLLEHSFAKIEWLKSIGKKVFATFDDGYHLMPMNNTVKDEKLGILGPQGNWRGGNKARGGRGDLMEDFRAGLTLCDGALVPSKVLLEEYRKYQPNIQYVPNYLYPPLWENLPTSSPGEITIGWGGTTLHNISWKESGIIPALANLCRKYSQVQVHLQPAYSDVVSALKKMGVRYITGDWQPFIEWPKTVSRFSIGVAPLSGNYDSHRSNLKCLEYATAGVPWVATDDSPYQKCVGGICVQNRSQSWYDALEEVLLQVKRGDNNLGDQGRDWSREFNSGCVRRYEEVFGL